MKVKLWGVRGSLPAPAPPDYLERKMRGVLAEFESYLNSGGKGVDGFLKSLEPYRYRGFGGHTACAEVTTPSNQVIVDGGSGIRRLGETLMLGPAGLGRGHVHIIMTHFHWDHIIGLPFFLPIFVPGNKIHFYAVQDDLEERIRKVFEKPNFPVPYEKLPSEIFYHKLPARKRFSIGDLDIFAYKLDHPDPCWGLRFEHEGRSLAYSVDTECKRTSEAELGEDVKLYRKADVLVFDAQYTFLEATEKVDWGHASGPIGLDLALREEIERVFFVHHDPAASDEKIIHSAEQTRAYHRHVEAEMLKKKQTIKKVEWCFAPEGTIIDV